MKKLPSPLTPPHSRRPHPPHSPAPTASATTKSPPTSPAYVLPRHPHPPLLSNSCKPPTTIKTLINQLAALFGDQSDLTFYVPARRPRRSRLPPALRGLRLSSQGRSKTNLARNPKSILITYDAQEIHFTAFDAVRTTACPHQRRLPESDHYPTR